MISQIFLTMKLTCNHFWLDEEEVFLLLCCTAVEKHVWPEYPHMKSSAHSEMCCAARESCLMTSSWNLVQMASKQPFHWEADVAIESIALQAFIGVASLYAAFTMCVVMS